MRAVLMSVSFVALAAACGGVGLPAEQDDSCAGDPTRPVTTEVLRRVLPATTSRFGRITTE